MASTSEKYIGYFIFHTILDTLIPTLTDSVWVCEMNQAVSEYKS